MGRHTTSNIQRLQSGVFTSFGSEWQPKNSLSPRVFGSGLFVAYTIPGSVTFVVPSGVTQLRVRVVGGGGNFAGLPDDQYYNPPVAQGAHGGGGGGGYAHGVFTVTPGTSYTVTVGNVNGTSSFGNLISATGGQPPTGSGGNTGGAGGTGSGGSFQATGGQGGAGAAYISYGGGWGGGSHAGGGGGAGSQLGNGGAGRNAGANGHGGGIKNPAAAAFPGDAFFSSNVNVAGTNTAEPSPLVFAPRFPFDIFTGTAPAATTAYGTITGGSGAGSRSANGSHSGSPAGVGGGGSGRFSTINSTGYGPGAAGIGGGAGGGTSTMYNYWDNGDGDFGSQYSRFGGSSAGTGLVVVEW